MATQKPPILIRSMTPQTVEADIARGFVAEFPQPMVEALPGQIATGEVTMLVAENREDGRPIGHVGIGWSGTQDPDVRKRTGDRVNIAFLGVTKTERGRGLGTALMLEAIATIRADKRGRGARGVCLSVEVNPDEPEKGNPSIRIYDRLGFVALGGPVLTKGRWVQPMELPQSRS